MFITDTPFNPNVEAGPPPMKLPSGDYIFFHNSWDKNDVLVYAFLTFGFFF
eukprot:m.32452 g.32452  ORF g.32452 m.32452 type:complete len:51 (+) comp8413_c0_seq1:1078-1230(+)